VRDQERETLGEMPRVVTLGERPRVGGNPWWETKVEIFGVMLRSVEIWVPWKVVPMCL
jgi:hypothetical protein